jgi:hypothetical protein
MTHRLITPAEAAALIRRSVRQFASDKVEAGFERDFQHWQNETVYPESVNRHVSAIGEEVK